MNAAVRRRARVAELQGASPAVAARFARLYERPVMLEVKALGRRFDSDQGECTALSDISFRAHRRELMCVIGPSGCGKSTLVRILAGLDAPTSGEMLLDGNAVHGPGPDRGMVFQGYTLFPWRTVLQNVMFGLEVARHGPHERRDRSAASGSTSSACVASPTPTRISSPAA